MTTEVQNPHAIEAEKEEVEYLVKRELTTTGKIIDIFHKSQSALVGLIILSIIIFLAVFAPVVTSFDPYIQMRDAVLLPPFWSEGGVFAHPLGTDDLGRDLWSRLVHGARLSILTSILCVIISTIVGISVGLFSGYIKGMTDNVIMRIVDVFLAMPGLLLALGIVAVLGPGLLHAVYAIAIMMIPSLIRLTRALTLSESEKTYVIAAKLNGASLPRILFKNILPNCIGPLFVNFTLSFSDALLSIAALGFLGIGAQPPEPEWGSMLSNAMQFVRTAWWLLFFPGALIFITVLSVNLLGEGIRDVVDPKGKKF